MSDWNDSGSAILEIDVEYLSETDNAILVLDETNEEVWVPRSQITDLPENLRRREKFTLSVSGWFAGKKGWV